MPLPHALILAGGRGERLGGVRKAELKIGGRKLLDRILDAMHPVAQPVLLSIGQRQMEWPGLVPIADFDAPLGGPLAGLAAGIDYLAQRGITTGHLVTAAVDTPFLPADYVTVMQDAIGTHEAAYAAWGDSFYPTSAVWRLEALQDLPAEARAGTINSPKALLRNLDATAVDWSHQAQNPFANINTMGDVLTLGRRGR